MTAPILPRRSSNWQIVKTTEIIDKFLAENLQSSKDNRGCANSKLSGTRLRCVMEAMCKLNDLSRALASSTLLSIKNFD
ncbi:hypothetical protein SUGI_0308190 [Cryptomeria japonica]|nr:hypothetical protein SUGI_0308190 [Cryptomeria japonica]